MLKPALLIQACICKLLSAALLRLNHTYMVATDDFALHVDMDQIAGLHQAEVIRKARGDFSSVQHLDGFSVCSRIDPKCVWVDRVTNRYVSSCAFQVTLSSNDSKGTCHTL